MARPISASTLNIVDLERILNDRTKQLSKLKKQRSKLQKQLDEIDFAMSKVSGGASSGGGGRTGTRAKNDKPLPDYIEDVLTKNGKSMRVGDIVTAVQAAGYKSTSPAFKNIVNQQLIKERKRFVATERGIYGLVKK